MLGVLEFSIAVAVDPWRATVEGSVVPTGSR
jgi:hypothetical protein